MLPTMRCFLLCTLGLTTQILAQPARETQPSPFFSDPQISQSLVDRVVKLEAKQEAYGDLLSTTQSYLEWSGWIGALITALLLIFSIWNTVSLSNKAKDITDQAEIQINNMRESETKLKALAENPARLLDALEQANYEQIRLELDDASRFSDALYRATFLKLETKQKLVPRIRPCIFDPKFSKSFFEIYSFVHLYSDASIGEFALQTLDYVPDNLNAPWGFVESMIATACEKSGKTVLDIYKHLRNEDFRRNAAPSLARYCPANQAWDFYMAAKAEFGNTLDNLFFSHILDAWKPETQNGMDHVRNLTSLESSHERDLYLERVLKCLTLEQKTNVLEHHYLNDFNLKIDPLVQSLKREQLTEAIAPIYASLPSWASYLDMQLEFDERIVRHKSNSPNAIREDRYLLRFLDEPTLLERMVPCFDLKDPAVWIAFLQNYNFDPIKGPKTRAVLNKIYLSQSPPESEFFKNVLPECLKEHYGLCAKSGKIFFGNEELPQQPTNRFDLSARQWRRAVTHPILDFPYFTDQL